MDKLQIWEINNLLSVIMISNKSDWERTRLLMYITAQVNSTKKLQLTDLLRFPWEEEKHDYTINNEDIKRLKERAKNLALNI